MKKQHLPLETWKAKVQSRRIAASHRSKTCPVINQRRLIDLKTYYDARSTVDGSWFAAVICAIFFISRDVGLIYVTLKKGFQANIDERRNDKDAEEPLAARYVCFLHPVSLYSEDVTRCDCGTATKKEVERVVCLDVRKRGLLVATSYYHQQEKIPMKHELIARCTHS